MKIVIVALVIAAGIVVSAVGVAAIGVATEGVNVNTQEEEQVQRGNKPHLLPKPRNLKVSKGKAGKKGCACTLNLDYDGVCENQPFFYYYSYVKGSNVCERFENVLTGYGGSSGFPGYLSFYDKCLQNNEGEPMDISDTYKTDEECYMANFVPGGPEVKIIDGCKDDQTLSTKTGKVHKSECKLNISNCTRTCSKDQTAYYLTKDDQAFGYRDPSFYSVDYPKLNGGCHHFLRDEIEMLSYNRCFTDGNKLEEYKNLDACCEAKGGCSEYKTGDSPVWRIDQCDTADSAENKNIFATDHFSELNHHKDCPTFLRCKQCIDNLSTQFPADTPPTETMVGESELMGGLDIKSVFDYTLIQSGVLSAGVDSSILVANIGECKPCIDHLVTKFTIPAFLLDKVEITSSGPMETQQSLVKSFFDNLLDEINALKRLSEINLLHLYDYLTTYYADEYLSTALNQQGVRRTTAKRAINFKAGC